MIRSVLIGQIALLAMFLFIVMPFGTSIAIAKVSPGQNQLADKGCASGPYGLVPSYTGTMLYSSFAPDLIIDCIWWKRNWTDPSYGQIANLGTGYWAGYIAMRIRNIGNSPITLPIAMNTTLYLDTITSQHALGGWSPNDVIPTILLPGKTYTVSDIPIALIGGVTAGVHSLIGLVDSTLVVNEQNETNNTIGHSVNFN